MANNQRKITIVLTILAAATAPVMALFALLAIVASSETLEWEQEWAGRVIAAFWASLLVWIAFVVVVVRRWMAERRNEPQ